MAAETTPDRFASVHALLAEYDVLEKEMADPSIHADQGKARQLGKRYAALGPVIAGYRAWKSATEDLAAGKEMAADDADFASEIPGLEAKLQETETALEELLLPRDPNDDRDVILEIKAGAGGDESALFAGDLLRMYQRFAERQGWKTEIIDYADSEMGGYKETPTRPTYRCLSLIWSWRTICKHHRLCSSYYSYSNWCSCFMSERKVAASE